MKIVNLQGMTTAERLAYLQEITQDIYNHLYDDFIWTSLSEYTPDGSYSFSALNNFTNSAEVKPYQIVYFSNNGWVALIDQINETAQTFTVINGYQVKGDKGDKGDIGNTGAKGDTGATALECQMIDSTSVPMQYNGVTIEFSKFSRNPVVGEVCNTFVNYISSAIYAVSIRVMTLTDTSANCRYEQVVNFTNILPSSAKKQLYMHNIKILIAANNSQYPPYVFQYSLSTINTMSENIATNDLNTFYSKFILHTSGQTIGFGLSTYSSSLSRGLFYVVSSWKSSNEVNFVYYNANTSNNTFSTGSVNLQNILNENSEYVFKCTDTVTAIGAGQDATNAAVLYSDKNGVLLDTPESINHDFAALKAAGSDESKILESINKVGSMNI